MKDSVIAELAIKAQQGDMQAFEKLYTEFSPLVYSILYEITHDHHEAEDLTQDCFVSALKNIHTLKEPAKAKKWLTAIAANHGKDYLKKKKPALLAPEHEYIFDIQEEENASVLPEESAVLNERSEEIREIVNSVSEDKRLCLVLFYQHEMSLAEISEELGISEAAVKSRLFRAREDIREEVEKRNKKGMPLFGIAPLPLILFALHKSAEISSASFAGSAAQAAAFTAVTATSGAAVAASGAAVTSGAAATGAAVTSGAASAAGAAAATTVTAKTVALIVTGAVVVGGGGATVAKVVHDRRAESTTAFVEETTELSSENVAVIATREHGEITVEFDGSTVSVSFADNTNSSAPATSGVTAQSSSQSGTTRVNTTTPTTKPVTAKQTTTAKPETTTKQSTTPKATTTVKTTTAKHSTTAEPTTAKPTTTAPPTTQSTATVNVKVYSAGSGDAYENRTLIFDAGETITATVIGDRLSEEYGIEAMVEDINITAQAGQTYTATAYQ